MVVFVRRVLSVDRVIIGLMGLGVAALYILALAGGSAAAYPMVPPFTVDSRTDPTAPPAQAERKPKPVPVVAVSSTDKLTDVFDSLGYRLEGVRRHGQVPRLFLASLPRDIARIRVPAERKVVFIKTALPLILHANELIRAERLRLEIIQARVHFGATLDADDAKWLDETRERYGLDKLDFTELLRRIDIIPPSLALAQAAEESGWGTSRFAREGNALFGQRTFRGKPGLVPRKRDKGKTYKVRRFSDLVDAVKSYTRNLNTHPAYKSFRETRSRMRGLGKKLDGYVLAGTLANYSERRAAYLKSIRTIMRTNGLRVYDDARLGDPLDTIAIVPDA